MFLMISCLHHFSLSLCVSIYQWVNGHKSWRNAVLQLGNLYMLFDNSQVIRAFAPNGIMLNEWALPVSVSEFDKQWEGMYLDQNGDGLYLHLALDSPLEVWSIKLGGVTTLNSDTAQWTFPRCAGG